MLKEFTIIWREERGMSVVIEAESKNDALYSWSWQDYDQSLVDVDYVKYINESMEVM
jgi:hypothetical protein